VFVMGLALIPGLPTIPFLAIGSLLFVGATVRARRQALEEKRAFTEPTKSAAGARADGKRAYVPLVVPWQVDVSTDLEAILEDARNPDGTTRPGLRAELLALCDRVFAERGVPMPPPRVAVRAELPERQVVLSLHEVPARSFRFDHEGARRPDAEIVGEVKVATLKILLARAADFLGLAETQRLLDELEQFAPATVRNVVPKPVSLTLLADVLRRLVDEGISIRDLRAVLEALSGAAQAQKDPLELTEYVRAFLRRTITYRLTRGEGHLDVVTLDPLIEDTIRRAITRTPAGTFLSLSPPATRDVLASLQRAIRSVAQVADGAPRMVILAQPDVRRFVRMLSAVDFPDVPVISQNELLPETAIRPLAHAVPGH